MRVMDVNPYESPREVKQQSAVPVEKGVVLEAFKSLEPSIERPKEEARGAAQSLPNLIANICWITLGLVAFGFILWAFGPVIAYRSMLFVGLAAVGIVRLLTTLGRT